MKLEFAHKDINEYVDGPLYFKNDGSAIEVTTSQAQAMLDARHPIGGKLVPVFKLSKAQEDIPATVPFDYPAEFPFGEVLYKQGFRYADALLLNRDQLIGLPGIGEKSADAILEFHKGAVIAQPLSVEPAIITGV